MADDADDLDYSESNVGLAYAQGIRKNISLKLRGKGRGQGRRGGKIRRGSVKKAASGLEEKVEETSEEADKISLEKPTVDSNLDNVISKLETPAFSPMDRTFPEPMHKNNKLCWDHKVNLIGEKVIDPLIHCCETCSSPILNYGRMIPCKHVFCFDCAKKADKLCPKCEDKVLRIEPSALGTVFLCTFGGTRHFPGPCGRTYLSQRDLQAHINHRHLKPLSTAPVVQSGAHSVIVSTPSSTAASHVSVARDPRGHLQVDVHHQAIIVGQIQHQPDHRETVDQSRNIGISLGSPVGQSRQYTHSPANYPNTIPASSARPNLITVPIQDDGATHLVGTSAHVHLQSHPQSYTSNTVTNSNSISAIQHSGIAYTSHAYQHPTTSSVYSQAPPITKLTFSRPPPPIHHQPPLQQPSTGSGGPIYSTPPPPVRPQLPTTYSTPRAHVPRPPIHQPPPQRFHEEGTASYIPRWGGPGTAVPPLSAQVTLPSRSITTPLPTVSNSNVGLLQPKGPNDQAYRQPYYQ